MLNLKQCLPNLKIFKITKLKYIYFVKNMFSNFYQNNCKKPKFTLLTILILLLSFGYFAKDFQLDASSDTLLN